MCGTCQQTRHDEACAVPVNRRNKKFSWRKQTALAVSEIPRPKNWKRVTWSWTRPLWQPFLICELGHAMTNQCTKTLTSAIPEICRWPQKFNQSHVTNHALLWDSSVNFWLWLAMLKRCTKFKLSSRTRSEDRTSVSKSTKLVTWQWPMSVYKICSVDF